MPHRKPSWIRARSRTALCCALMLQVPLAAAALDPDGNGLYDDVERAAMLAALQAACPELAGIDFDADDDGRVSILEQTAGRHPLSLLVPSSFLSSGVRIPWAIDVFPEWIMTAYLQEDVPAGAVTVLPARGVRPAQGAVGEGGAAPSRAAGREGIAFAPGQQLVLPGHRNARWDYRWCVMTFRIDGAPAASGGLTLLDLNRGQGPNRSSPKIWYESEGGLHVQYVAARGDGLDRRVMRSSAVVADGESWNVLVCGIRQGRMYAELNGVVLDTDSPQPDRFIGPRPEAEMVSVLGDSRSDAPAWALDALVLGITEPSEAMVRKLSGWAAHRLGFHQRLPAGHPYRDQRPVVDAADFPERYVHDDEVWTAWGQSLQKAVTRVNAGGERVEPVGFERVFYDDFRADRISASMRGEGDLWMAPGFNTAVGASIPMNGPDDDPDVYPYDATAQIQTLSLGKGSKGWRASGIYTVDDAGQGYTWAGEKIFRIRCRFPAVAQEELAGGLFPAFWSYDPDYLYWRTANRIEVDWFEFDGQNGRWYNGISSHFHYAHVDNIFAKNPKSYKRYKVYSGELSEEKGRIPGGLYVWDGQFHTWEFVVEAETTYVNVTLPAEDGTERWVEICRCPTAPTYLQRLDLQLDYALKSNHGEPESERQDFDVDFIEVLQKTSRIEAYAAPFQARPRLIGSPTVGATIRCDPQLQGITDVRYYWFADGYPLTYGSSPSYTLGAAEAGSELRCMVKAVGATSMPEAWSEPLRVQ